MGWRFRHSFKVIPGVRLNLSKSGLSASFGAAPFTLNVGAKGAHATASIPGTGISYRQHLASTQHAQLHSRFPPALMPVDIPPHKAPLQSNPVSKLPIEQVQSGSTELMTSESLKELKHLIQTAHQEHREISNELDSARSEKRNASDKYSNWENGFLLKRIFKKRFAERKTALETAEAKVAELEEQLRLTKVATHIEIDREQAEPYFKMRDVFAALSECAMIWDIKSHQAIDKFHQRTTASVQMSRKPASFSLQECELLEWNQKVPHIRNSKGGEMFFYPGFILYRVASEAFSVISYHDIRPTVEAKKSLEEERVPSDSMVVGQTWAKANKDGSPDRRFANNRQIPIVLYAWLTLKSDAGLWEEFVFSNVPRLKTFIEAYNSFVLSFAPPFSAQHSV